MSGGISSPSQDATQISRDANAGEQGAHVPSGNLWAIALAALGVVYGDIGTSPLYALRECFHGPHAMAVNEGTILGVLSLLFWCLIFVISIKYMIFVLSADNRGEGGILALTALAVPQKLAQSRWLLFAIGIFGAALLYGDGVITPAISVLSAVEGLKLATPLFEPYVIPITIAILIALFAMQKHGTAKIGAIFGPIILVWFGTIGALGLIGIFDNPSVLTAVNPVHAWDFFVHHKLEAYFTMGALFLVVTGGEALYADMGHFGKRPIRWAWFTVVLPGLLLNYFGQGALLLKNPEASENPFYLLAPQWLLLPLVVLATAATVIASQALISGVFSLTRQAIQLGLSPRLQIIHTSNREIGQIYLPHVNWALLIGTIWLVVTFRSSSNLAAAYGISVSATMVITTILLFVVTRSIWNWNLGLALTATAVFLLIDFAFFSANVVKIGQGGYVPLLIGAAMFTFMSTWRKGRQILADRLRSSSVRLTDFLEQIRSANLARVPGTAVFMVGDRETTPPAMVHNVKHNKVMHDVVIILTLATKDVPTVDLSEGLQIELVEDTIYRVVAKYGFTDSPDVPELMELLKDRGVPIDMKNITFFLGRETLIASNNPGMAIWREHLFSFMSRNAQRATAFFNIPADQVIEVGMQVEL
jgi:KUP system potassium uptake protein